MRLYFIRRAYCGNDHRNRKQSERSDPGQDLPVTTCFVTREEVPEGVDLSKLPEDASATLRIVKIGEYDTCACIGQHVGTTAEIGKFKIISWDFESNRLRLRFKLEL